MKSNKPRGPLRVGRVAGYALLAYFLYLVISNLI
jgi:hypothetical protein